MATAKAIIDVHNGKLLLTVLDDTIEVDVFESMKKPTGGIDCFTVRNQLVSGFFGII